MQLNRRQSKAGPYMRLVIACGGLVCLWMAYRLPIAQLNLGFPLLSLATLLFGARVVVQIPRVKGQISVSDTFVFLCLLLFGCEAAVLLAAADACFSSLRISKSKLTILFNTAAVAISTFLSAGAVRLCFGSIVGLVRGGYGSHFIVATCLMALVQYISNSGIVATGVALKAGQPVLEMWRKNFLWTSVTYFAGASAAALIARLIGTFGLYAFLATLPIIAVLYFTYTTYLKKVEEAQRHVDALKESEERFRSAFDHATIGMALVSAKGRWLQVNQTLCKIVGYTQEELLDKTFQDMTHPEDLAATVTSISHMLDGKLPAYQTEQRYLHKQGHAVWIHLGTSTVRDAQGNTLHLIFHVQDITNRKRAEEQLLHDAFHDALTGLPNRALFTDHLKMAMQRARRNQERLFAVLFLDLDRFKVINDSLGHMVGDQLLVGIARRLETCLRPGDTVARLGGDEFTILLEDLSDTSDAVEIAQRIHCELSIPFNLSGHEVFTTTSIGIASSSIGYERAEDILRDADTAMYRAKMHGKNRYELFDKAMHDRALNILQLETDLRRGVERQEFFLQYQPIVSMDTGEINGFEALVRWHHPERGFISPIDFIPVAEETGLIIYIGQWVLREACRQFQLWQRELADHAPLTISVNLSGRQFSQPDLVEQIASVIKETGINPQSLKLEITETMVMENIETAIDMLAHLRALGVEISIDDFGTGYSSLSYLHRFPINTLKIDRSFVSRMMDNGENAEIVRTIITLARSLEMKVVAEGVETEMQYEQLKALGCDAGQGYLFSRPVMNEEAFKLLTEAMPYRSPAETGNEALAA